MISSVITYQNMSSNFWNRDYTFQYQTVAYYETAEDLIELVNQITNKILVFDWGPCDFNKVVWEAKHRMDYNNYVLYVSFNVPDFLTWRGDG